MSDNIKVNDNIKLSDSNNCTQNDILSKTKNIEQNAHNSNISNNQNTKSSNDKPFKVENLNFYPTKDFPHLKVFNANYKYIKEELLNIIKSDEKEAKENKFFQPWIEHDLYEESNPSGWDVGPLMIGGKYIDKNCNKAKFLYNIIKDIPGLQSASFSLLKPGTHIVPHKGYDEYSESILRFHMGIFIPNGDIGIRVGNDVKVWKEGESFIFDDFIIHEAWNFSKENRYVLICDFCDPNSISKLNINDNNFNKSVSNYLK